MNFNSIEFILFLPIVIGLFYSLPHRFRWILLLLASYFFYASWKLEYLSLIIISTLIDYLAAIQIEKTTNKLRKKLFLGLSLTSNLGILFFFKYFNFFTSSLGSLSFLPNIPELDFLLPVGISFYTFQTLSYTIEVYQGKQKAERHLGIFAVYVSYFPQLVAGPIERFSRLGGQLKKKVNFSYDNLANGMRLIIYGLFIKMVIADNLAASIDPVHTNPNDFHSLNILMAMIFYSFQIYSDFFGYSLVAIGSARLMGIHLMDNFNAPYLSRNISEFWGRWHISLSTWFRDYLYFPLGGNRVKFARWFMNIMVVFLVSGLWHGANWTFVIWGGIFGIAYLLERVFNKLFKLTFDKEFKSTDIFRVIKTFIIVTLAWVFFRSASIGDAFTFFKAFINNWNTNIDINIPWYTISFLLLFILTDILFYNHRFDKWCANKNFAVRWTAYSLFSYLILVFSGVNHIPFIYFQF